MINMKRILLSACILICTCALQAQPAGGFGGWQMPEIDVHCSERFADVDYVGDGQVYHKLDIYLPKVEKTSYPVAIHIYGSAWFSNSSKGMADLGTIVNALLDAGYAVVTPNHRSSMDAKFPAQIHDIKAVVRFVRGNADKYRFDTDFIVTSGFSSGAQLPLRRQAAEWRSLKVRLAHILITAALWMLHAAGRVRQTSIT